MGLDIVVVGSQPALAKNDFDGFVKVGNRAGEGARDSEIPFGVDFDHTRHDGQKGKGEGESAVGLIKPV